MFLLVYLSSEVISRKNINGGPEYDIYVSAQSICLPYLSLSLSHIFVTLFLSLLLSCSLFLSNLKVYFQKKYLFLSLFLSYLSSLVYLFLPQNGLIMSQYLFFWCFSFSLSFYLSHGKRFPRDTFNNRFLRKQKKYVN